MNLFLDSFIIKMQRWYDQASILRLLLSLCFDDPGDWIMIVHHQNRFPFPAYALRPLVFIKSWFLASLGIQENQGKNFILKTLTHFLATLDFDAVFWTVIFFKEVQDDDASPFMDRV